ncbi:MAG: hypothetical protein JWR18_2205 [Segetibacter sp.]|nr:hypothetical protein [Segetibacter sp.]
MKITQDLIRKSFKIVLLCIFLILAIADISQGQTTTWTGAANTDWSTPGNWSLGVPADSTITTIPSALTNYPVITTGISSVKDLTIQTGASLTVNLATLKISGTISNSGTLSADSGTIEMNGAAAQSVPALAFSSNTIKNLIISNPTGVSVAGVLRITGTISFGNVNNSVLTTNGFITLVSTSSNTASLADITNGGVNSGNQISGDVTVERFLTAKRAYRFITSPVNSSTDIRANWMENTNNPDMYTNLDPAPGFGTQITGAGGNSNRFDATQTNNSSLFTFNNATQTWAPVTVTTRLLTAGTAYRLFVRGSRSTDLTNNAAAPSVTTIRATGALVTGTVVMAKSGGGGTPGMPELSPVAGSYNFVANPYASVVNWINIDRTNISESIYVYDPTISGTNGRGAYVSYNSILQENSNSASSVDNYIQSGLGFFVQATGTNPSITFKETYKGNAQRAVFRTASSLPNIQLQLLLPSLQIADGTKVYFSDAFNQSIANEDSYKFTNLDENIAVLRDGQLLSMEGRKSIVTSDSVPIKIWQLLQKNYTLKITLNNFTNAVQGYLEDKYLKTSTLLNYGESLVPFSINSDTASFSPVRFRVMFKIAATLSVNLTGIKAYVKNKGIQVEWTAESESNMERYEVERWVDAQNFTTLGSAKAKNNPAASSAYGFFDINPNAGDNYYRIKSVEKSGDVKLSEVVRVQIASAKNTITVVNNPVQGKTIRLMFDNVASGNYSVSLTSAGGEKVYDGKINNPGGTSFQQLELNSHLSTGIYQLHITNGATNKTIPLHMQ